MNGHPNIICSSIFLLCYIARFQDDFGLTVLNFVTYQHVKHVGILISLVGLLQARLMALFQNCL